MKFESRYHEKLKENQNLQKELAELKERLHSDASRYHSGQDQEKKNLVNKNKELKAK